MIVLRLLVLLLLVAAPLVLGAILGGLASFIGECLWRRQVSAMP